MSFGTPESECGRLPKSFWYDQFYQLYKEQLYSNVLNMGGMILTLSEKNSEILSQAQHLNVLIYVGDAAYNLQEYPLAESYYKKALQKHKTLMRLTPQFKDQIAEDCCNDLKYKLYLCNIRCNKLVEASNTLQSIPAKQRTPRINMALGKLYLESGMERSAVTAFKEVLRECPLALDAIEALMSLGQKEADIINFMQQNFKFAHPQWFSLWLRANSHFHGNDLSQAVTLFKHIQESTPLESNHSILVSLGKAHLYAGDYQAALVPLKLAHLNDPINMNGMDNLAFLLWTEQRVNELEKLVLKLAENNHQDRKCEPWIALAYFAQMTNRSSRALHFAHRATLCVNHAVGKNPESYLAKGNILLSLKKYQEALDCFREAIQLVPSRFEPHKGLIDCYLAMNRYRDAVTIATSASKKLGQNPRSLTMCASAMQKDLVNISKAKTYLEKALSQDPKYLPAVFMLVEILETECAWDQAIKLLEKQVAAQCSPPKLHLKLADLLCKINKDDKAAEHFSIALRLEPTNREAKEALSRLDPSANRAAVHEPTSGIVFEVDDVELDEEEEDAEVNYDDMNLNSFNLE